MQVPAFELLMSRAARYAAASERCTSQLRRKLRDWGATPADAERILTRLVDERLVDDARFARVYAHSKQRQGWGALKVRAGLRQLSLPDAAIAAALAEMAAAGAPEVEGGPDPRLLKALEQKARTLKAQPERERSARLYRFALQRGFAPAQIRVALARLGTPPEVEAESPYEE